MFGYLPFGRYEYETINFMFHLFVADYYYRIVENEIYFTLNHSEKWGQIEKKQMIK